MYISNPTWMNTSEAIYQQQRSMIQGKDEELKEVKDKERLMSVAREFEAIFYHQLFKSMRKTIPRSGFIDGGFAETVFEDFLDYEIARMGVEQATGGLADMIYQQYSPLLSAPDPFVAPQGGPLPRTDE